METTTEQIAGNEDIGQELLFNSQQVKDSCLNDMDFFAGVVMPEVATLAFPDFYLWLWGTLAEIVQRTRDFSKYAIGLPRGHGKTMVVKLFIVYCILFTKKKYILVIGANVAKAKAIVADVCDMLDSANVQTIFGNWRYALETDTQELKKFTFMGRSIIIEAAGYGTAIRGANQKNSRPDLIVFDDAQTKDCAESITEAKSFQQWFIGTALKAKSPSGCTFIYIGNMYKDIEIHPGSGVYCCMLRNLQMTPGWTSFIVGAILAGTDTKPVRALWEELQPLEQLLQEFRDDSHLGQPEIFFAEVLNDPKTSTSYYLDTSKIVCRNVEELGTQHQGNFIVIDPATSKQTPDQMVIHYFEIHDNIPVSVELLAGKYTAPDSVQEALKLALKWGCGLICVESNAYQFSLCQWFMFVMQQMRIEGIHIQDMYSCKGKVGEILKMFKVAMKGEMMTSPNSHARIIGEGQAFDPTRTDNIDDIWDSMQMAHSAAMQFRHLMIIPGDLSFGQQLDGWGTPDQESLPPPLPF